MEALSDGDLTLRAPRETDDEALARLVAEPDVAFRWVDGEIERDHGWVVEVDGRFAGWIQYGEETDPYYRSVGLDIALTTSLHGGGYGRRALRLAIDHFAGRGHHRFTIDPDADNERAIRCYTAVGFKPVGVLREYTFGPDGNPRDGLLMDLLASELPAAAGP